MSCLSFFFFFFFQAEDGIRDTSVTGVQTCALPISPGLSTCLWWIEPPTGGGLARRWASDRTRTRPRPPPARLPLGGVLSRSPTHGRLDGGGHGPHFVASCVPPHGVFGTRYGTKIETI